MTGHLFFQNRDRANNRYRPDNNHPALCHLVPDDATTINKPDQVQDLVDLFFKKSLLNQYSHLPAFRYKDESGYGQEMFCFGGRTFRSHTRDLLC
ncbi:MAG TPA: hypothetical protein PK955_02410 [Methanoregulaceae archaeon]|nr:hypothetical protein [Methanoregulaceae archaeon]